MPANHVTVRNIPAATWDRLRIEAVRRHRPLGELVTEAIEAWLTTHAGEQQNHES